MKIIGVGLIMLMLSIPVLLMGTTVLSVYQTFRYVYEDVDTIAINIAGEAR